MTPLTVVDNRIEVEHVGSCATEYTGTREDLIAAGYADASMFPEGRKRTKSDHEPDTSRDRQFSTRYVKGGRWAVRRTHAPRKQRELWNPDTWKAQTVELAANLFDFLQQRTQAGEVHRISTEDQERIGRAFDDLLGMLARAEIVRAESERPYLRPVG